MELADLADLADLAQRPQLAVLAAPAQQAQAPTRKSLYHLCHSRSLGARRDGKSVTAVSYLGTPDLDDSFTIFVHISPISPRIPPYPSYPAISSHVSPYPAIRPLSLLCMRALRNLGLM